MQQHNNRELVAKDFLEKQLEETIQTLRLEMKLLGEQITRQVEDMIIESRDILLSALDPFMKELEESRQDRILSAHQTSQTQKKVDNHEIRIKKLKNMQNIT